MTGLADGYTDVRRGKIAAVVTSLEMTARAAARPVPADPAWQLRQVPRPDPAWFRDLYRRIGEDWLWFSRLALDDAALARVVQARSTRIIALEIAGRAEGLIELEWQDGGATCELVFFGVTAGLIGTAAARVMMNRAIAEAWSQPIRRFWVHTCTFDHPAALAFYRRSGFTPFRVQIEVADDPRLSGLLPPSAAPQIPVIEPP